MKIPDAHSIALSEYKIDRRREKMQCMVISATVALLSVVLLSWSPSVASSRNEARKSCYQHIRNLPLTLAYNDESVVAVMQYHDLRPRARPHRSL